MGILMHRFNKIESIKDIACCIIWVEAPGGRHRWTAAAGSLRSITAAWPAMQNQYKRDTLTLQYGELILAVRLPIA